MFESNFVLAVLAFIVVIGPLILFQELGHFWAARIFNIKVEEFGIGFPPRAATLFERKGTVFTLNLIPLGGFVRPAGEDDPDVEGGLASAPPFARFCVLAAGAFMNMVVAFVLMFIVYMLGAPSALPGARIQTVVADSPAAQAGLQAGDIITAVDDVTVDQSTDLTEYIFANAGEPILVTLTRAGETLTTTITPREDPPEGQGPTGIIIEQNYEIQQYGPFAALGQASAEMAGFLNTFIQLPRLIVQEEIPARYFRPVSVVGISQLGGQQITESIEENAVWPIVRFTAYISVALAVTNLLPIPALDGGRILFVLIEVVRGKRVKPEHEMTVHFIGFAALLALMVVFIFLDIVDPLVVP
ncbi:MAG: RIP metalloprotease [Anaerolineae bacterium]